jgi:hypothetical protein
LLNLGNMTNDESVRAALLQALTAARSWGHVEALGLSWNSFDADQVRQLVECPRLAQLRWLDLSRNNLGPESARALGNSPHVAGLTSLAADAWVTNDSLKALAKSRHLRRLARLDIGSSSVGDAGVAALVRSPVAERLRVLNLSGVGDATLRAIAESPRLGRLTVIGLGGAPRATDAGARALARSKNLPNLAVVTQHWEHLTAAGQRALLSCKRLAWPGWFSNDATHEHPSGLSGYDFEDAVAAPLFPWSKYSF